MYNGEKIIDKVSSFIGQILLYLRVKNNNQTTMHEMNKFRFWNNTIGWMVFFIATASYILTIEPTQAFGIVVSLSQRHTSSR